MSALAGIWYFDGRADADRDCGRMLAAQAIYGPHDDARRDMGNIAMGRRLFRTLPEDIHDNQPLSGGGGRFILVADVRLDNRDALIGELRIAPDEARQMADSAILLQAWERWQESCFDHLVGEYAFALWDKNEQRLTLARDPLSFRPLHYHRGRDIFAFASMPKGLHTLAEVPRAPNEDRIAEFLALMPESGTETFFKGVDRIEGGCFVTVTRSGITTRRFWDPPRKTIKLSGPDEYAEALREHLDTAVRSTLRGAGNAVAAHLSSGFDSSAVVTSAATEMARRNGKVVAFTAVPRDGYDKPGLAGRNGNEGPIAAMTAARYPNIEHVKIASGSQSPLADLDRNFFVFERPVLNLCNSVWSQAINEAARERKLNVLLVGQMGNMTISYDGLTLFSQLIRSGRLIKWARESFAAVRQGRLGVLNVLNQSFGPYTPLPLFNLAQKLLRNRGSGVSGYSAITEKRAKEIDLEARAKANNLDLSYRPRSDGHEARLWVMRRVDMGNYHKGILGGWGIDSRDPTADRRLIEFCLTIPEDQFLRNGDTKALARRAFASRMPPEVTQASNKGYQAVDWHEGLTASRPALREELERLDSYGPTAEAIDLPRLKALVENWPQGDWNDDKIVRNYRLALMRAVSTGHFFRRAGGSNA